MIKKTDNTNIREMLKDLKAQGELIDNWEQQTLWTISDIKHYIKTETDDKRLAKWCTLFINNN